MNNGENRVELLGCYGNDLVHACSAWTSTSREIKEDKLARVPELLKMLAEQGHHTPFEKSCLHFLVTTDIASHIHLLKHRIGVSINAESARYKELKDDLFFVPQDWPEDWQLALCKHTQEGNRLYHECLKNLCARGFDRKRAKESARFFKTYNSQIQCDVMFNWRSFAHFMSLRNKKDAQVEICEISCKMLKAVKGIEGNPFEHTIAAFRL